MDVSWFCKPRGGRGQMSGRGKIVSGVLGKVRINVNKGIGPGGAGEAGTVRVGRGGEALAGGILDGRKEEGRERGRAAKHQIIGPLYCICYNLQREVFPMGLSS